MHDRGIFGSSFSFCQAGAELSSGSETCSALKQWNLETDGSGRPEPDTRHLPDLPASLREADYQHRTSGPPSSGTPEVFRNRSGLWALQLTSLLSRWCGGPLLRLCLCLGSSEITVSQYIHHIITATSAGRAARILRSIFFTTAPVVLALPTTLTLQYPCACTIVLPVKVLRPSVSLGHAVSYCGLCRPFQLGPLQARILNCEAQENVRLVSPVRVNEVRRP